MYRNGNVSYTKKSRPVIGRDIISAFNHLLHHTIIWVPINGGMPSALNWDFYKVCLERLLRLRRSLATTSSYDGVCILPEGFVLQNKKSGSAAATRKWFSNILYLHQALTVPDSLCLWNISYCLRQRFFNILPYYRKKPLISQGFLEISIGFYSFQYASIWSSTSFLSSW